MDVVVVDNGSSDGSAEMVSAQFPLVKLLRNTENLGFARAANQALRARRGRYALLLNPDVTVCHGALQALYHCMENHPRAGAATGRLIGPNGHLQEDYYRRDLKLWEWLLETAIGLTWGVGAGPLERRRNSRFDEGSGADLSVLPGGCMMVRQRVLDEVGLLDEDFFVWYEDVDWCRRIRSAGWTLRYCPSARFQHEGGASFALWRGPDWSGQLLTSLLIFLDKHFSRPAMVAARALLALNFSLHLLAFVAARQLRLTRSEYRFSARDRLRLLVTVVLSRRQLVRRARWETSWRRTERRIPPVTSRD